MVQYCIPGSPPSFRQYSMNPERQHSRGSELQSPCFGLSAVNFLSITHSHTFSHSCTHSIYLTVFPPVLPLSPYIRPSSIPLALMLMHSQSGCPLSWRALHVHQDVQRPACKWAPIAVRCKLLEISLEGERECKTCMCEKCWKNGVPARPFYANETPGDKHYKGLTESGCLFDVLMQWSDTHVWN